MAPLLTRHLIASYRSTGESLRDLGSELTTLVAEANELLGTPGRSVALVEVGHDLLAEAADIEERLHFLERTDGFDARLDARPLGYLTSSSAQGFTDQMTWSLARDLARAGSVEDLMQVIDDLMDTDPFRRNGPFWQPLRRELRPIFATSFAIAIENGLPINDVPSWFLTGVLAHGEPDRNTTLTLAHHTLGSHDHFQLKESPNPFGLDRSQGIFGPAVQALSSPPDLAPAFVQQPLIDHDVHGRTVLNMHHGHSPRAELLAEQLAELVVVGGAGDDDIASRTDFVDRLVRTINADGNTNTPVFWATWAVHAELVLEHDITTTEPTFGVHHLVPDTVRPHWKKAWDNYLAPATIRLYSDTGEITKESIASFLVPLRVNRTFASSQGSPHVVDLGPGNDPGGTYSTRTKAGFVGLDRSAPAADRGRQVITQALRDASPGGPIAADEFAITDHGIGPNGKPTFTVNLPGVIDLSNPVPGFDPVHQSVRDMDQVAIRSAPTASVADNQYALMVIEALRVNNIPPGSNLLFVGHSFGADTVLDLAASTTFAKRYNVTHVVAAAYDSVPQLASVDPSIDVLVLQNSDDKAIALEAFHRAVGQGDESVSTNTFAHEVREFPGGFNKDIGHHPDRYIDYLRSTQDPELDRFLESVTATGYANSGATVAIDVSLDPSIAPQ